MEKTLVFVPNLLVPGVAGWVSWTPTGSSVTANTRTPVLLCGLRVRGCISKNVGDEGSLLCVQT